MDRRGWPDRVGQAGELADIRANVENRVDPFGQQPWLPQATVMIVVDPLAPQSDRLGVTGHHKPTVDRRRQIHINCPHRITAPAGRIEPAEPQRVL
jgi:hypothetical protein